MIPSTRQILPFDRRSAIAYLAVFPSAYMLTATWSIWNFGFEE